MNRFVDHDMVMQYHVGLGVGHTYAKFWPCYQASTDEPHSWNIDPHPRHNHIETSHNSSEESDATTDDDDSLHSKASDEELAVFDEMYNQWRVTCDEWVIWWNELGTCNWLVMSKRILPSAMVPSCSCISSTTLALILDLKLVCRIQCAFSCTLTPLPARVHLALLPPMFRGHLIGGGHRSGNIYP
jgi:hypothetical protein